MSRFFLCLFLFFVAEVLVIIQVGRATSAFTCISLLFLSLVIGILLIKFSLSRSTTRSGGGLFMMLSSQLNYSLFAGILFIIPGFITDVLGIILLIPWVRGIVFVLLMGLVILLLPRGERAAAQRMQSMASSKRRAIDVNSYTVEDDDNSQRPKTIPQDKIRR